MIKTTKGFVAVTEDGQFLRTYIVRTHVGDRVEFDIVSDLDQAEFFRTPGLPRRLNNGNVPNHNWAPVEERREVVLLGYGVEGRS